MTQPDLPFGDDEPSLRERFDRFHADNPRVYELLCQFAARAIERGRTRYGVAAIFEAIRWHVQVETRGDDLKLNNNFRAYYARLWLADHPEHPEFFETRFQRAEAGA